MHRYPAGLPISTATRSPEELLGVRGGLTSPQHGAVDTHLYVRVRCADVNLGGTTSHATGATAEATIMLPQSAAQGDALEGFVAHGALTRASPTGYWLRRNSSSSRGRRRRRRGGGGGGRGLQQMGAAKRTVHRRCSSHSSRHARHRGSFGGLDEARVQLRCQRVEGGVVEQTGVVRVHGAVARHFFVSTFGDTDKHRVEHPVRELRQHFAAVHRHADPRQRQEVQSSEGDGRQHARSQFLGCQHRSLARRLVFTVVAASLRDDDLGHLADAVVLEQSLEGLNINKNKTQ